MVDAFQGVVDVGVLITVAIDVIVAHIVEADAGGGVKFESFQLFDQLEVCVSLLHFLHRLEKFFLTPVIHIDVSSHLVAELISVKLLCLFLLVIRNVLVYGVFYVLVYAVASIHQHPIGVLTVNDFIFDEFVQITPQVQTFNGIEPEVFANVTPVNVFARGKFKGIDSDKNQTCLR